MDIEKLIDGVVDVLKAHVTSEVSKVRREAAQALADAIAELPAARDGKDGSQGPAGRDGASVTLEQVEPVVARAVSEAVARLPAPQHGRDGINGKDGASVSLEAVQALVGAEVLRAVAALPKPVDGKDGTAGLPGKDAPAPDLDEIARRAAALIPKPRDGADGRDGMDGKDGAPGKDGRDGAPGKDGDRGADGAAAVVDVDDVVAALKGDPEAVALLRGERGTDGAPGRDGQHGKDAAPVTVEQIEQAVRSRFAEWALDFERLATDRQRAAIDSIPLPRDGRDGKDGRPGAGIEDFEFDATSEDGGRTIEFTLRAGGREVCKRVRTAVVIDTGPYRTDKPYQRGDGFTYGSQFWIVQRDDPKGKPGESADFRLSVRKGRDAGRDAIA